MAWTSGLSRSLRYFESFLAIFARLLLIIAKNLWKWLIALLISRSLGWVLIKLAECDLEWKITGYYTFLINKTENHGKWHELYKFSYIFSCTFLIANNLWELRQLVGTMRPLVKLRELDPWFLFHVLALFSFHYFFLSLTRPTHLAGARA